MLSLLYSDWSFQSIGLVLLGFDTVIASSRVDNLEPAELGGLDSLLSGACEVPMVPRLLVCPVRLNCPNRFDS